MPQWNPRKDPGLWPAQWHHIARAPESTTHLIAVGLTARGVKAARNKWAAFRSCLKAHPNNPTTQAMVEKTFRCRSIESPRMPGYWDLWVDVMPGLEELYKRLGEELRSLRP